MRLRREAESYNGPSLIVAYATCVDWGHRCVRLRLSSRVALTVGAATAPTRWSCSRRCCRSGNAGNAGRHQPSLASLLPQEAVESGYWPLYRFDPRRRLVDPTASPLVVDSARVGRLAARSRLRCSRQADRSRAATSSTTLRPRIALPTSCVPARSTPRCSPRQRRGVGALARDSLHLCAQHAP